MLKKADWSQVRRRALGPTEIVKRLAELPGWKLSGDGHEVAIERTYQFADYYETISFVNALAFIAHQLDHHPDLSVHYNRCVVRFSTHDVKGISETDFACAARADALLA
jgi:4a-hydroxytetrahydrobiopterin dehydratase